MPVLARASPFAWLQRQVAILAYQYGAGLCHLLTLTYGVLVAIIAAARVPYEDWLKFVLPLYLCSARSESSRSSWPSSLARADSLNDSTFQFVRAP